MGKEYSDRWSKPLVNPGFTWGEYEEKRKNKKALNICNHICNCEVSNMPANAFYHGEYQIHAWDCPIRKGSERHES